VKIQYQGEEKKMEVKADVPDFGRLRKRGGEKMPVRNACTVTAKKRKESLLAPENRNGTT